MEVIDGFLAEIDSEAVPSGEWLDECDGDGEGDRESLSERLCVGALVMESDEVTFDGDRSRVRVLEGLSEYLADLERAEV